MKREFVAVISAVVLGVLVMYLPMRILTVPQQPSYVTMEGQDMKAPPGSREEGGESAPVVIDSLTRAGLVFSVGLAAAFGVMLYTKRKFRLSLG